MFEAAKNFDLATEPFLADDCRDLWPKNFYSDLGIRYSIVGENDISRASLPDEGLERISLRQRSDETLDAAGRSLQTIRSVVGAGQRRLPTISHKAGNLRVWARCNMALR